VSSYAKATFDATLRCFLDADGLPFADVLDEQTIEQFGDAEDVHFGEGDDEVYSPPVTLWGWLSQVLSDHKSCVAAVARILVLRVALGLPPCSAATGGYCKARAKLPERFIKRLALHVGTEVERQAPDTWRWHNRRVLLVDGFECSMPDTAENQAEYPQSKSQKPGLGFPQIRMVVLLAFATACLVGCAMGPRTGKETGETALFRQLLELIKAGDIVVADRYHCSYWQIAALLPLGADAAFRLHASRHYDFRRGKRLGKDDHVVTWHKPARPDWMDEETYQKMPETLSIREVRFKVGRPGYRPDEIIVATTLTDPRLYSKEDIADLYDKRWHVELDIRAIKQTLKMDILSCKTPEMVRKEIWIHLLAYNLTRKVMAQAAQEGKITPRQLSLAGAVQTLNAFRWLLMMSEDKRRAELAGVLCIALLTHKVGNRPGRCEPRKVKRRPKSYGRLMRPRAEEKARLMGGKKETGKRKKKKS
jgi:Transposase DDE domain